MPHCSAMVRIPVRSSPRRIAKDPMTTRAQLQSKSIDELRQIADDVGIETDGLQKSKLITALVDAGQVAEASPTEDVELPQATPRTERVAQNGEEESDSSETAETRPGPRPGGR